MSNNLSGNNTNTRVGMSQFQSGNILTPEWERPNTIVGMSQNGVGCPNTTVGMSQHQSGNDPTPEWERPNVRVGISQYQSGNVLTPELERFNTRE